MRQRKAGNAAERAFFAPSAIFCRGKEGAHTAARPNIAAVVGLFVLVLLPASSLFVLMYIPTKLYQVLTKSRINSYLNF